MAVLLENFASGYDDAHPSDQTADRIRRIIGYISQNYTRHISLEEISDEIGFHPQYFSAYFKKHFGTGFVDYLNTFRVSRSTVMLRDTNESVLGIALACG
ncbi:MAG: helix-turn-helix transcriptional regulator, partial [Bacteroidales bacterium]|nr:helix-turn-helix transcriptional regulator [Bacteroidales bacterium]